jgi:hypothetical protein
LGNSIINILPNHSNQLHHLSLHCLRRRFRLVASVVSHRGLDAQVASCLASGSQVADGMDDAEVAAAR